MKTIMLISPDELTDHADRWEALRQECHGTAYALPSLTKMWLETFGSSATPRIILIEDKGELVGIAPMVSSHYSLGGLSLKVLSLVGEVQNRLRLSTTSVMFKPGRRDVLERIMEEIRKLDWSMLTSINMLDNDLSRHFIEEASSSWRSEQFPPGKMLSLSLPETGDITAMFDRSARKNIRKRTRSLEREGHGMEFRRIPVDGLDRAVDVYARQHIERWGTKGGSYFRFPENCQFLKRVTHHACENGYGFAYELLIDDEVAAQTFGFLDGDVAYSYRVGMNNSFMDYSPGWQVKYHAYADLRDRGVRRCIMGIGGERYKYEMGGKESSLIGIRSTRGPLSLISRIVLSAPVQMIDSRLRIRDRMMSATPCGE